MCVLITFVCFCSCPLLTANLIYLLKIVVAQFNSIGFSYFDKPSSKSASFDLFVVDLTFKSYGNKVIFSFTY